MAPTWWDCCHCCLGGLCVSKWRGRKKEEEKKHWRRPPPCSRCTRADLRMEEPNLGEHCGHGALELLTLRFGIALRSQPFSSILGHPITQLDPVGIVNPEGSTGYWKSKPRVLKAKAVQTEKRSIKHWTSVSVGKKVSAVPGAARRIFRLKSAAPAAEHC